MKLNTGIVRSNALCIGCNRCMTNCPVPGANISVASQRGHRIEVNAERCISCGQCIDICPHKAREYVDDTDRFFADLAAGKSISLVIDPAFRILYPDRMGRILAYLRSLGAEGIYDISFGADICTWAAISCYQQYPDRNWISSACASVVETIEKFYPDLVDYLLPVLSPLQCLTVYVRQYLHDDAPLAYIGPCIAKQNEQFSDGRISAVSYRITLQRLFKHLEGMYLEGYEEADLRSPDLGYLYAINDGIKENLSYFMPPKFDVIAVNDLSRYGNNFMSYYTNILQLRKLAPFMISIRSDHMCCVSSSTVDKTEEVFSMNVSSLKTIRSHIQQRLDYRKSRAERVSMLNERFSRLVLSDFKRSFVNRYRQPFRLPADVLHDIFQAMDKTDVVSQSIDCGFCGYPTCQDMAKAIAYGFNQVENCIHYTRKEALRLYYTDGLTGIPSWNGFRRDTKELLWNHPETAFVIVYFNIQNFKMVNDLYGFAMGDQTLKMVAGRIQRFVAAMGTCGRVMGDHFILCMPETRDNVQALIETIRQNIDKHDLDFPISFDLGFYRIKDPTVPFEVMMDCARLAQLTIKGSYDVGWAYYDEAMHDKMRTEAWVTKEMRRALDEHQFQVYLQPQYDHRSRRMVGAEALVRWLHPERGLVTPREFIPVFERNFFICQMDHFVWERTCQLLRDWLDRGLPVVPVSVNISRICLYDNALPQFFATLREQYHLPRQLLRLEITESAYTQDPEQLVAMVTALRNHGFIVEMDDFGSGYSSLTTLHEMPIDVVKLDLRFITGSQSQKGRAIIKAVVYMMQILHLGVIAEGVETAEQADFLVSSGCSTIQGYYYSQPLPATAFEARLQSDSAALQDGPQTS